MMLYQFHSYCSCIHCTHVRGYQQQDAHEFMRYLLDKLHTELIQVRKPQHKTGQSIVSDIFEGILQSDVSDGYMTSMLHTHRCSLVPRPHFDNAIAMSYLQGGFAIFRAWFGSEVIVHNPIWKIDY